MNLFWILIAAHVLLCVFLVLLVLVQNDKGGGLAGALTGGSSNAAFSGTGAASAISKLTTWVAVAFMAIILGINVIVSKSDVNAPSEQNISARKELSNVLAPSQPANSGNGASPIVVDPAPSAAPTQAPSSVPVAPVAPAE